MKDIKKDKWKTSPFARAWKKKNEKLSMAKSIFKI